MGWVYTAFNFDALSIVGDGGMGKYCGGRGAGGGDFDADFLVVWLEGRLWLEEGLEILTRILGIGGIFL
ncbi:MAG TPA: hypothetical protein VLL52_23095, partial [Anaerolineae bacterium]|nr:hypothetical protein [Anaerolineae bacterium]